MLTLEGATFRQGDFTLTADWTLERGTRVALIGPSGAGKSTLLQGIGGYIPAATGRVLWDGHDLALLSPGKRPVTMLFQDQNLFPHMSVADNIGLGLSPDLRLSAGDQTAVERSMARTGLDGLAKRRPADLSGGQQGRVALARALLRARPILMLDEPFSALGPGLKAEMLTLVAEVARETSATLLMVTHDPHDARALTPLMSLVANGTAARPEATGMLLDDPPPALRDYLG